MGVGLARSLAPVFRQPGLTTGAQTVSDVFNVVGGAADLSRASTPAATAGGALRTVSGLSGLGRQLDLPGAGPLSAVTGLGSAGLNLARGNIPGGVQNLITGAGTVANLFPVGATLAGVPVSAAGGAAMGGAAAAEAGIGLGGGAPLPGASLAGAAGALAIPLVVGQAVENIVNAALGEGAFGQTPLPFTGRGVGNNWLSSADNRASQISAMTGLQGAIGRQGAIEKATDPGQLLGLALEGPGLSPHGELQFYMLGPRGETLSGGKGGVQQTPTNAAYDALVRRAAQNDPQALREFISRVRIQSGESGAARDDYVLTDWYRRKLVSLLPETHPVRRDLAGLFEATPASYLPEARAQAYLDAVNQMEQQTQGGGGYSTEGIIQQLLGGSVGHGRVSTLFRPESELMTPARAAELARGFVPYRPAVTWETGGG